MYYVFNILNIKASQTTLTAYPFPSKFRHFSAIFR